MGPQIYSGWRVASRKRFRERLSSLTVMGAGLLLDPSRSEFVARFKFGAQSSSLFLSIVHRNRLLFEDEQECTRLP